MGLVRADTISGMSERPAPIYASVSTGRTIAEAYSSTVVSNSSPRENTGLGFGSTTAWHVKKRLFESFPWATVLRLVDLRKRRIDHSPTNPFRPVAMVVLYFIPVTVCQGISTQPFSFRKRSCKGGSHRRCSTSCGKKASLGMYYFPPGRFSSRADD